ncbi:uncharacterized protein [Littorina saxatilis]|uniref:Cytochrome P450 n=1 Tax=Littorina saxatilis TaxID=31220 RepID=A0AAN9BWJ9_9CAEN
MPDEELIHYAMGDDDGFVGFEFDWGDLFPSFSFPSFFSGFFSFSSGKASNVGLGVFLVLLAGGLGAAFWGNHYYTKKWTRTWADRGIPSPPCVTVFGNFLQIKKMGGLRASVRAWIDEYGNKFGFHIGQQPVIVVADGTTAEEVLEYGEEAFCPVHNLNALLRKELGDKCLSLSKDGQWNSLHYIMATVLCSDNLIYMVPRLNRCANILGEYFEDISNDVQENQLRFSVTELATSYSYDVLAAMLIGEELDHYSKVKHPFFTVLQTTFTSANNDYNGITVSSNMSDMRKYFEERVEERKSQAHKEGMVDFLDIFTHAGSQTLSSATSGLQYPTYAMTPAEIVGNLMHWVLHGHSTVVSALQFVLHMLASFPDHQQLIFAEINKNIMNAEPTFEELSRLKFMDLVIKEVLRIFSPVQEIWRQAKTEIETEHLTIPAKAEILIPKYIIHSDSDYFFEPDLFEPERYLAKASVHRSELFLTFGSGPRTCIGYELALLQLKIALVHIVRKVKLMRAPSEYNIQDSYMKDCQLKGGLSVTDEGILRPMKPLRLLMEPRRPQDVFKLKPKSGAQTATTAAGAGGKEMDMLKDKAVHFNRGGSGVSSAESSHSIPSTDSSPAQTPDPRDSSPGSITSASGGMSSSRLSATSTTSEKGSGEFGPSLDDLLWKESKAGTAKSKSDQFYDAVEADSKVDHGHLAASSEAVPSEGTSDEGDKKKKKKKKKSKSEEEEPAGGSKTKLAEKANAAGSQDNLEGGDGKKHKKKKKKGLLDDDEPEEAGGKQAAKSVSKEAVGEEGSKKKKKKKKGFLDDSGPEEAGGEQAARSVSNEAVGKQGSKKKDKKKKGFLDDQEELEPQSVVSKGASSTGLSESEGGKEKKKKKKKDKGADGTSGGENLAATSGDEAAEGDGKKKKKKKKDKEEEGEKGGDAPATSADDAGEEGGKKKKKKKTEKDGVKNEDAPATSADGAGEEGEKKKKKKKKDKDGVKSGDAPATSGNDAGEEGGKKKKKDKDGDDAGEEEGKKKKKKKKEIDGEKSGDAPATNGDGAGEEEGKKKKKKKKDKDGEKSGDAPATSGDDAGEEGGKKKKKDKDGDDAGEEEGKKKKKKKKEIDGEKSGDAPATNGDGAGEEEGKKKKKKKKDKDGEKSGDAPATSGDDAGEEGGKKKKKKKKDGEKSVDETGGSGELPAEGEEGGEKKKKKKIKKDGEKSGDEAGGSEGQEGDENKKKKKKKKDTDGDPPDEGGSPNNAEGGEGAGGEKKKKKKKDKEGKGEEAAGDQEAGDGGEKKKKKKKK